VAGSVVLLNPFANKVKSGLQVITEGASASLFLNDQYLDKTPFIDQKIMPGNYQLEIVPDDPSLANYELPISLNKGYLTVVVWIPGPTIDTSGGMIYELEPLSNKKQAEVSIISNPDQTLVTFGTLEERFTPILLRDLEPDNYNLEIKLVSFDPQKHTVTVIPGHRLNITIKLARNHQAGMPENADQVEEKPQETAESSDDPESMRVNSNQVIKIKTTNFFQDGKEVLRVRQEASLNSQTVGYVSSGKSYDYLDEKEGWFFVEFTDPVDAQKKQGWLSGEYVEK